MQLRNSWGATAPGWFSIPIAPRCRCRCWSRPLGSLHGPATRPCSDPPTTAAYLLGVNAPHHRLFPAIAWSTEHVAHQTLERAAELHLPATAFYAVELATDTAPVSSQCNLRS